MDNDPVREDSLRTMQIESFGRIMAGFSHDMKNHLGIIRESNGLISDILEFQGIQGDEATLSRINKAVEAIERRIVTAAEMLHHLSGFAHRSDTPYSSFHINDLLEEEYAFLHRFSRLKQVECNPTPGTDLPPIYNNPSLLQHMVYRLFMFCLEHTEAGNTLELSTEWEDGKIVIGFTLKGISLPDEKSRQLEQFAPALQKVHATLNLEPKNGTDTCIALVVPSLTPEEC